MPYLDIVVLMVRSRAMRKATAGIRSETWFDLLHWRSGPLVMTLKGARLDDELLKFAFKISGS